MSTLAKIVCNRTSAPLHTLTQGVTDTQDALQFQETPDEFVLRVEKHIEDHAVDMQAYTLVFEDPDDTPDADDTDDNGGQ